MKTQIQFVGHGFLISNMTRRLVFVALVLLFTTLSNAQVLPRTFYGARLEPKTGILVGAGQTYAYSFNEFSAATSKVANYFMTYITLNRAVDTFEMSLDYLKLQIDSLPSGVDIQLGITFSGRYNDRKVGDGVYDANIITLRNYINSSGRKWFLRIGYEFNLWTLEYTAGYYVKAFRRVASFFTGNNKVATVWSTAGGNGNTSWANAKPFYPGDDVVDWWGWDFFKGQYEGVTKYYVIEEFCDTAGAHKKPVMLAEVTPYGNEQQVILGIKSWNAFFVPMFKVIQNLPQIKSFAYVNWNWPDHADFDPVFAKWGDTRLQSNQLVRDSFNSRISNPVYIFKVKPGKLPVLQLNDSIRNYRNNRFFYRLKRVDLELINSL